MDNRPGILGRVATTTGFCDSNIENIQFDQTAPGEHIAIIDLSVASREVLSKIINGLRKINGIHKIRRFNAPYQPNS